MSSTNKFKVESGVQLLARLFKRSSNIENFYAVLFQTGLKSSETIEMFSEISLTHLLTDLICEALIPVDLGGPQLGTLLVSTDGNIDYNNILCCLHKKLLCKVHNSNNMENLLNTSLSNLVILKVYDATQFYTTIYNIESIMMEHSNISLVIFDTLTAFYWSEQGCKITKMDLYIKNLLTLIRKITKDYKITLLYTRPEYFSSSKDTIDKLEACSEHPTADRVNHRIQLVYSNDEYKRFHVNVKQFDTQFIRYFNLTNNQLNWISSE